MKFFQENSLVYGLYFLLFTLASSKPISKRSTQIDLKSYTYQNNVLSGSLSVQNIAFAKAVNVFWAAGSSFQSTPIKAVYSSGPSNNYETWTFSGPATGATQFYVQYTVSGQSYYIPGNFQNFPITPSSGSGSGSTPSPQPTGSTGCTFTTTVTIQSSTASPAPTSAAGLDAWTQTQYAAAEIALKRNIGSDSNTFIPKGVVIASPSTQAPNYYYQWIRDASIVVEHLVNEYLVDQTTNLDYILNWITSQKGLQQLNNPSGSFTSGGLGEPKFNVDGTAFTGPWGRPQRDGPALRAATLMKFATSYLNVSKSFVTSVLYDGQQNSQTVIKADLDYVVQYWNQNGFDLWEEVNDRHFFTTMVQYRSMVEGATFATLMGDSASASKYTNTAASMVSFIQSFWNPSKGFIQAAQNNNNRQGLDCGTLLGSLRGNYIFKPSSQEVLATTNALISSMQNLYGINSANNNGGYAIGRYPEDVYDGGNVNAGGRANPWFICTTTVAHTLYRSVTDYKSAGSITVTSTSLPMFQRAVPSIATGTYAAGSAQYNAIITGFNNLGDAFLTIVQNHAMANGSLSEQFGRDNGQETGARDLTWSYESILEAIRGRNAAK